MVEFDAFEEFVEPFVFAAMAGKLFVVRRVHVRAAGRQQLVLYAVFAVERRDFFGEARLRAFNAVELEELAEGVHAVHVVDMEIMVGMGDDDDAARAFHDWNHVVVFRIVGDIDILLRQFLVAFFIFAEAALNAGFDHCAVADMGVALLVDNPLRTIALQDFHAFRVVEIIAEADEIGGDGRAAGDLPCAVGLEEIDEFAGLLAGEVEADEIECAHGGMDGQFRARDERDVGILFRTFEHVAITVHRMVVGKGEGAQLPFTSELEVFFDRREGVIAPLAVEMQFELCVFGHGVFSFCFGIEKTKKLENNTVSS